MKWSLGGSLLYDVRYVTMSRIRFVHLHENKVFAFCTIVIAILIHILTNFTPETDRVLHIFIYDAMCMGRWFNVIV